MEERREFGFCPKCGALMQDGVCQSCGYGSRGAAFRRDMAGHSASDNRTETPAQKKKMSSGVKIIIGIVAVILVLVILLAALFAYLAADTGAGWQGRPDTGFRYPDYNDGYYDDYDSYGGYYVPDKKDEYYEEITDATVQNLSYQVLWQSTSVYPDDAGTSVGYTCICPVLTGEDKEKLNAVNERIQEMVCEYQDSYLDYDNGVESYGYVTYMDEEICSIVVEHSLRENYNTVPYVRALTFHMDTGEVMEHSEMTTVDETLIRRFRSMDSYQNGTVDFVSDSSDEELQAYLEDEKDSVMFYTPVGLEVGFNYDGGWVTVTIKDQAL